MPFFYISNGLNETQEDTSFVSQSGVEQSILLESGLARSIVSRVIRTLHFASCIVAGKKRCVNIIKKKLPDQYLRLWLFSLLVYQSPYYAWLSMFSQLLQLDPNLIGEFVWFSTTAQKQGTEVWLSQFQACTSPFGYLSGICHFVLEKLQMPHGGAGRSYQNPTVGIKNRVQMAHPGQHQNYSFQ